MFKSTFAKYLTVFVVILLISFLLLTSIVTTTIRDYVIATKEESLVRTSAAISAHFEKMQIEDIKTFVSSGLGAMGIIPIINQRNDVKIILTDADGNILLTTVRYKEIDGVREPVTFFDEGELGSIDFGDFTAETLDSVEYLCYDGELAVIGEGRYHICSMPIRTSDVLRGYAVSILDVGMEDGIISNARKTIINSSLWIMLSAIIALYLITERVINPLKNMTKATKSFAKGDFSTRVQLWGTMR